MPLIIANNFPPEHGGIQRYMERLALSLHKLGTVVRVVAPAHARSAEFDKLQPYRIFRYRTSRNRAALVLSMILTILRAAVGFRSDYTIASIWFPSALAALCLPKFLRGPLGIVAHGSEIAPSRSGRRRGVMKRVFGLADAIFPNSAFTRDLVAQIGPFPWVEVVPCGVDEVPAPRRDEFASAHTLLSVGRLVPRKGFDLVIAALPELQLRFPKVHYDIVGDGPYRAALVTQADRLALRDVVTFHGAVSDDQLERIFQKATCFVLPVRIEGTDVEGFGIVYLEAAMASLPVIGGKESGAGDAIDVGTTGYVVGGRDVDEIVAVISDLLDDPDRAREMGKLGRQRAIDRFKWSTAAERIHSCMKQV